LLRYATLLLSVALLATTNFGSLTAQASDTSTRQKGHQWVARNLDGRLEAFMLGSDAKLYHKWQTAPNSGWVADWASLGEDTLGAGFWSDPSVGRNKDGRLEVFAVTSTGHVEHIWQTAPNSGWVASFDPLPTTFLMKNNIPVAVANNQDGRLEVFARDHPDPGKIVHIGQVAPNSGWAAAWLSLGDTTFTYAPSVGINGDGRLEVFAVKSGGDAWHVWQTAPNSGWVAWNNFKTSTTSPELNGPLAVASNKDGRLEVFGRKFPGYTIIHNWQAAPNSGWAFGDGPWASLGTTGSASPTGDPAVGRNGDGRLEVFASAISASSVSYGGEVWHTWQTCAGCGWGSFAAIGGFERGATSVGQNADARLEVFDHTGGGCTGIDHAWQVPSASSWSAWGSLGGTPAVYDPHPAC
jgi:hypothetical protein